MQIQGFKPVINANSRVLILGSMPSEESLRKQEYYANPRNQFWRILDTLFSLEEREEQQERQERQKQSELLREQETIPAAAIPYSHKLEFILQHNLALWDVIAACEREGSLDSHIKSPRPNLFAELFAHYPEICYVAFNGKKAFEVFKRQVGFNLKEGLVYHVLPSTSPANTLTWERKLNEWRILRAWLK
ncbi:DNA-deoxyinosine glycosylase [Desulfitobacterium sp.]|uniref:DNA-deoxyinosine glycosylase n=1 Tax=Desulfitobacterium sp. TaxID=49981 RepID=UPI002B553184|nr:DNA-deoxyinosine glycosylase [Desulfitobacterium sp.]HVJ50452.1 DNA-deoxyinosine glycosylase [Desulfitobacterium sp.]